MTAQESQTLARRAGRITGVLPYLVFLLLDVWSLRNVLVAPGIIGHVWDWAIPAFADQNLTQAQSTFWSWDELAGGGNFNPLKSVFNHFITFPLGTLGGEIQSKLLIVLLMWGSAVGMYLFARKGLNLSSPWGSLAAVLYMLSPLTYSRLIAGYLTLILGQALLPVLVLLCLQVVRAGQHGSPSYVWKMVAAGMILGVSQATHSSIFLIAPLIAVVILGTSLTKTNARRTILAAMVVLVLGLLLNVSWITSFGINYLSSGSIFHGGGSSRPTDQITLASVTDWRANMLDSLSQSTDDSIRLSGINGIASEIVYPIPGSLANAWLFVSFLLPLFVFSSLLARKALTPAILSLLVLGLIGVAMVSGTRTFIGASLYEFLKRFAPPAWAEFGNTTRAFPLVALSYCAIAPLALQHASGWVIGWLKDGVLATVRNALAAVSVAAVVAGVTIWCAPFLSGDINRPSDKDLGLKLYTVQPEDRTLYESLRANPNSARMVLIPPPGIWGPTDYGWVWEAGNISPRPKFLATSYNPDAWRAASDFSVFSPDSRAGKMLGLAAVEQVVFPFARISDAAYQAQVDSVLAAQSDLVPVASPVAGTTILKNKGYLPRIYSSEDATMILGSSDLLASLSTTPYFGDQPALFFSTQQSAQDLDALAAQVKRLVAPFQTYSVTSSSLITVPVGFAHRPVSIETRPVLASGDSVTREASFSDLAVASAGIFSATRQTTYVVRLSTYAPAGEQTVNGQPAFPVLDDSLAEIPATTNWKFNSVSSGSDNFVWTSNTLFDKRATGHDTLEVRALLGDPSRSDARVEFTRAIKPFNLDDYPVLQVQSVVQDPAMQLVEVHLGVDWNGDGGVDDNWALPIAPQTESKRMQFAIRDFVKKDFPGKAEYRVVSVSIRLTRRPKIDPRRIRAGLYSFGLSDISFLAPNRPNAKSIQFLPDDATADASGPSAEAGILAESKPGGLTLTFPTGGRATVATLERTLAEVTFQQDALLGLAYQTDGPSTFDLDCELTGLDAGGTVQTIPLGIRTLDPFARGTLVLAAPKTALREPRIRITLGKLVGSPEFRASSVTLSQFKVSRQSFVPSNQAEPNVPFLSIDDTPIALAPMPASQEQTGAWFTSRPLDLTEGRHSIVAGYDDAAAPYRIGFVEVSPAAAPSSAESSDIPAVSFRQINPTRYVAHVENATAPYFLVFSESFNAGWQAYVQAGKDTRDAPWYEQSALLAALFDGGKRTEMADHYLVNGYANSWYVQKKGSYNIILEFAPQRLYEAGVLATLSTPLVCFVFLLALWLKRRRVRESN